MNRRWFLFVALAALAACGKESRMVVQETIPVTLAVGSDTRTVLNEREVLWLAGDAVSVFDGVANRHFTTETGGTRGTFSGNAVDGSSYKVLYPYHADATLAGGTLLTALPAAQTATPGSFAPGANLSAGLSWKEGEAHFATMYNAGCFLKFTVGRVEDAVLRVSAVGVGGESLAGAVVLSFEDGLPVAVASENGVSAVLAGSGDALAPGIYYLVLLPGSLSAGLKISVALGDGQTLAYRFPGLTLLERNAVYSVGEITQVKEVTHEGIADCVYPVAAVHEGIAEAEPVSPWAGWTDAAGTKALLQQAAAAGKTYFMDYKYYNYESYSTLKGKCEEFGYPHMFSADLFKASSSYFPAEETARIRANLISVVQKAWAQSRCLPALSWHLENPYADYETLGGSSPYRYRYSSDFPDYPASQRYVVRQILDNTNGLGDWFDTRCRDVAELINALVDASGAPIPVIFRLFHECEHSWAWWQLSYFNASANCSTAEYVSLFRLAVTKFRSYCPDAQILFCYNTDRSFGTEEYYLRAYPGDDYVDIMSYDDYAIGNSAKLSPKADNISAMLKRSRIVTSCAKAHGKIAALFETNNNSEDATEQATFYSDYIQVMLNDVQTHLSFMGTWSVNLSTEARKQAFKDFIREPNIIFTE